MRSSGDDPLQAARKLLLRERRSLLDEQRKLDRCFSDTVKALRRDHERGDTISVRELASALVRAERGKQRIAVMLSRLEQCQIRLRQVKATRAHGNAVSVMTEALADVSRMLDCDGMQDIATAYRRTMATYQARQELLDMALDAALDTEQLHDESGDGDTNAESIDAALHEVVQSASAISTQGVKATPSREPLLLSSETHRVTARGAQKQQPRPTLTAAATTLSDASPVSDVDINDMLVRVLPKRKPSRVSNAQIVVEMQAVETWQ